MNDYLNSKKKRLFDLILSINCIIIFIPIFIICYPILRIMIGNPVLFKQKRVGKNKKVFNIYKIRTMHKGSHLIQKKLDYLNEAPSPMFKIKNDPRFTKIGRNLSQLGIDEIPQIINIIKGEMSFIGPRPLPIKEAHKLGNDWNFRYKILPGITSYWAISPNKHRSLNDWKQLELQTSNISGTFQEITLIMSTIYKVLIKPLINQKKAYYHKKI